jgi:hypothetical protein
MGRRCRHLNPSAAGAWTAVDSRFITASNGDPVSTWAGRSSANLTSSGTQRPTYQVNITGGQPALYFDGVVSNASGQYMSGTPSVTSNSVTLLWVNKTELFGDKYGRVASLWNSADTGSGIWDYATTNAMACIALSPSLGAGSNRSNIYRNSAVSASIPYSSNTWTVASAKLSGTNVTHKTNKTLATGTTSATSLNSDRIIIGNGPPGPLVVGGYYEAMQGYIAAFTLFLSALSDPMVKRLEEAMAYSFRLPYG